MAKENFERTKPHVNVGSNSSSVEDTSGQLSSTDRASTIGGEPTSVLDFSAPSSSTPQSATVAFPIDGDFTYDPLSRGFAAESMYPHNSQHCI